MNEHTILVAVVVVAETRKLAHEFVQGALDGGLTPNDQIDSWWIAEDDRMDGSDCDSAVFVKPGLQQDGDKFLEFAGIGEFRGRGGSPNANDRSDDAQKWRDRLGRWKPDVPDDTPLDLVMRVCEALTQYTTCNAISSEDWERLQEMFADA